jgi:hypothetical protein
VDVIGHWLAGHEPGNFGLFHMARERGMTSVINPENIPLYDWSSAGMATLTPLTDFVRTPLLTYYLRRDYGGWTEPYWHLCNESIDYGPETVEPGPDVPKIFVLHQNYPNPFNSSTSIQYAIPRGGNVLVEVFNVYGERLDILVNGHREAGNHMVVWASKNAPSGTYFLRMTFSGHSEISKMMLLR